MKNQITVTLLLAGQAFSSHVGSVSNTLQPRAGISARSDLRVTTPDLFLVGEPILGSVDTETSLSDRDEPTQIEPRAAQSTAYINAVINHHNAHRLNHSAPKVTYSNTLAGYAATVAASCKFAHNLKPGGGGYGQNLAAMGGSGNYKAKSPVVMVAGAISDQWYNSEFSKFVPSQYGLATPNMTTFLDWGHFTQVIWKGSTKVGCASQYCAPGKIFKGLGTWFTVCDYKLQGNFLGNFDKNVGKPLGKKTVTGSG